MAKHPYIQFYTGDYLKDTRSLSLAAKGAWSDIIVFMHTAEQRGVLTGNNADFARMIGGTPEETTSVLLELCLKKVCDRRELDNGVFQIICRRMVRESQISKSKAKNGSKGGSKTQAKRKAKTKQIPDIDIDIEDEFKNKKESQSQDSTLITNPWDSDPVPDFTQPDVNGDTIIFPLDTKPVRELWASWKKYRWKKYGLQYGMFGEQAALKRLDGLTLPQIEETITAAIQAQWQNLYPEKSKSHGRKTKQQRNIETLADGFAKKYGNKSSPDSGGYSPF